MGRSIRSSLIGASWSNAPALAFSLYQNAQLPTLLSCSIPIANCPPIHISTCGSCALAYSVCSSHFLQYLKVSTTARMSPIALEKEDHARDAAFNKAMHGKSAATESSMRAMLQKDRSAQQAAVEEYFKHWDKSADEETEETRKVDFLLCSWFSYAHIPLGSPRRVCHPHQALLQHRHRSVRVWLVPELSLLPLCLWRALSPSYRSSRALPSSRNQH